MGNREGGSLYLTTSEDLKQAEGHDKPHIKTFGNAFLNI